MFYTSYYYNMICGRRTCVRESNICYLLYIYLCILNILEEWFHLTLTFIDTPTDTRTSHTCMQQTQTFFDCCLPAATYSTIIRQETVDRTTLQNTNSNSIATFGIYSTCVWDIFCRILSTVFVIFGWIWVAAGKHLCVYVCVFCFFFYVHLGIIFVCGQCVFEHVMVILCIIHTWNLLRNCVLCIVIDGIKVWEELMQTVRHFFANCAICLPIAWAWPVWHRLFGRLWSCRKPNADELEMVAAFHCQYTIYPQYINIIQ